MSRPSLAEKFPQLKDQIDEAHREARQADDAAPDDKPELLIDSGNLPATAHALRDILAASPRLFTRADQIVVKVDNQGEGAIVTELGVDGIVMAAHELCRPVRETGRARQPESVTLPDRVAKLYLSMRGELGLKPLDGATRAPILEEDGTIRSVRGYDPETRLWCCPCPELDVPDEPSRADAEDALLRLRWRFRTFAAADAVTILDKKLGVRVVDLDEAPGQDESAILAALLTACCRSSLLLAPGFLVAAPELSGSGVGKGLLVRAISTVAFGGVPASITAGPDRPELEKRLSALLVRADPAVCIENVNGVTLKSDMLSSVLTDRPAEVRLLGQTRSVLLNSAAWIALTGNGLRVSEDLARRFITCSLDARQEDPESRPFAPGFLGQVARQRSELLSAALTIWRWGRLYEMPVGIPLGSFETWAEWVRDPLLRLGCADPVARVSQVKQQDGMRLEIAEIYTTWWRQHGSGSVRASDLDIAVLDLVDPQKRGRQHVTARLDGLTDTRLSGYVLTRQKTAKWSPARYALRET
jgi:hypothetical protein